jgi:hypothetical protein
MNPFDFLFGAPRRRGPSHSRRPRGPGLPPATDLGPLAGRRVLAVVDDENLRISMTRRLGVRLSYRTLRGRLEEAAAGVTPVVVFSAAPGDDRRARYFSDRGWHPVPVPIEVVMTRDGPVRKANADFDIAFEAGRLAAGGGAEAVLVGTGDGELGVAIARGMRRALPGCRVFALGVPGSTSRRLHRRDLFDGVIYVGRDLARAKEGGPR